MATSSEFLLPQSQKLSFGESNMEQVIFFSGILFGQIIGIFLGPKIYQTVKSKIESYRNRKTTQQTQIIVDGNKIFDNEEACCGYVPECLCPSGEGWGDYMIMHIDENGQIADWDIKKANSYIDGDWK